VAKLITELLAIGSVSFAQALSGICNYAKDGDGHRRREFSLQIHGVESLKGESQRSD